jgi:hypothetical protein
MQSYAEIHQSHTGKVSDKWSSYLPAYDRIYRDIRLNPVRILEIGVQNGGSLEVLDKYFPNAAKIVGCDIVPACGALRYANPNVSVIVGDANAPEVRERIASALAPIDLLIDDGSHRSADIIATFAGYFPLIAPGGIYLIEDTATLYAEAWGGGVLNQRSAQYLFKQLIDVINYEHWHKDATLPAWLASFFPQSQVPPFMLEGWVESVEFLNSMIVVRKARQATHFKLGERLIVGTEAAVAKLAARDAAAVLGAGTTGKP